jgi:hypothetical protein
MSLKVGSTCTMLCHGAEPSGILSGGDFVPKLSDYKVSKGSCVRFSCSGVARLSGVRGE